MTVKIRLLCVEVPFDHSKEAFEIDLPPEATVDHAIQALLRMRDLGIDLDKFRKSSFFVNGAAAALERNVADGDTLTVIRTLAGG